MREIKFRAWVSSHYRNNVPVSSKGKYKNCAVEQFTGLHDKNGVEIYEGDILLIKGEMEAYPYDPHFPTASIEPQLMPDRYGIVGMYPEARAKWELITSRNSEEWEIIGNIHDNPELMKKEK